MAIYRPEHFSLDELVCQHVYQKFGDIAWQFFDERLLKILDLIRNSLKLPIFVNNWLIHGNYDERGFRCIQCSLVQKTITENRVYVSPHMTGQGVDFDVEGMTSAEVRLWIIKNDRILPCPIRLEGNVNWVHLDTRDAERGSVYVFNP